MDIAKYAGLFFLRSEYVYLPGIGNLEIRKKPSSYSSEYSQVEGSPAVIEFTPVVGVVDDTFANFVANNERVSIASAANAIREFGKFVKMEIAESRKVEIPGVGYFYKKAGGLDFEVDSNYEYKPKSIPVFRNAVRVDNRREKDMKEILETTHFKEPTAYEEIELERPKVNYGKLVMLIIIALVVLGGIVYLIYYLANNDKFSDAGNQNEQTELSLPEEQSVTANPGQETADSLPAGAGTGSNSPTGSGLKIIVNEYRTLSQAEARVKKLTSYNYAPEVVTKDSSLFFVVVNVPASAGGEQATVDSIKQLLNPRYDVRVYQ